ncbi:uncharacterized protein BT62DRAFT_921336 [Guyanagaster necrorhizus]|uniref:Uncharacterized protein n=1 Tax=Guyanagaster necrorhizus TaxID=856835 RepID=A0A9P7VRE5_9AGAR|nr:uncharacterized protein BT62DRAFT_921336 [Guyanagaster necrorhizus MCA 3950]KAG7444569.1 hypothetical protein BT62DRAFT_921336 [Guyanagaster necrorhizus MCA 3950]
MSVAFQLVSLLRVDQLSCQILSYSSLSTASFSKGLSIDPMSVKHKLIACELGVFMAPGKCEGPGSGLSLGSESDSRRSFVLLRYMVCTSLTGIRAFSSSSGIGVDGCKIPLEHPRGIPVMIDKFEKGRVSSVSNPSMFIGFTRGHGEI